MTDIVSREIENVETPPPKSSRRMILDEMPVVMLVDEFASKSIVAATFEGCFEQAPSASQVTRNSARQNHLPATSQAACACAAGPKDTVAVTISVARYFTLPSPDECPESSTLAARTAEERRRKRPPAFAEGRC